MKKIKKMKRRYSEGYERGGEKLQFIKWIRRIQMRKKMKRESLIRGWTK